MAALVLLELSAPIYLMDHTSSTRCLQFSFRVYCKGLGEVLFEWQNPAHCVCRQQVTTCLKRFWCSTWTKSNLLNCNQTKTVLVTFFPKQNVNKTANLRLKLGSSYMDCAKPVRKLGIILEKGETS